MHWVKDLASLQRLGSLLWSVFHPWLRNFCMPWMQSKIKKKKKERKKDILAGAKPCMAYSLKSFNIFLGSEVLDKQNKVSSCS